MKTNPKILWLAALCASVSGGSLAGPVGPLTIFTGGTPARASEVNANFSAVAIAVNDNNSRITTLESRVSPAGNFILANSTATTGNILKGLAPFIHNFGIDNTFIGLGAGNFAMTGSNNTAIGVSALLSNTSGALNTASGVSALQNNTTGDSNTASGRFALLSNMTGDNNTASGANALQNNTTGDNNTASGVSALLSNTSGISNTASGLNALQSNVTGNFNTASGSRALENNTTGDSNIAVGFAAGLALTTGSFNIAIGNGGVAGEAQTIRIGSSIQTRAFIAGIRNVTTGGAAIPVLVDSNGQLGTTSSSRRVKDDISEMGDASSKLMKLRPVTFHYKSDRNPAGRMLQYGLVAEEVAKVAPGLVARSADGKIETVYYQFLAPMLLNEVQKQQRTIAAQTARLEQQAGEIAELRQHMARMTQLFARLEQSEIVASAGR